MMLKTCVVWLEVSRHRPLGTKDNESGLDLIGQPALVVGVGFKPTLSARPKLTEYDRGNNGRVSR